MKISPMPATGVPTPSAQQNVEGAPRPGVLKMVTNANSTPNLPLEGLANSAANEEPSGTVEATQPISPQLAALARQKRALQMKERQLLQREKAMKAQSSGPSGIDTELLKSQPLKVLLDNGVTYEQLTEAIMGSQNNSEVEGLKQKIASLEQTIDKKFVEKDEQTRQEALANIQDEVLDMVNSDDNFELIRGLKQSHEVVRLIDVYHQKTGKILNFETACQWVEDQLLEDNKHLAGLRKFQQLFSPRAPQPQQRPYGIRTLTNAQNASPQLSAKARAMAAFYGNLRK